MTRARTSFATALLVVVVAAGCAGGGDEAGERPITDAEAARLAETLFANHESGGASFELNGRMPDGTTVHMAGEVDWSGGSGRATVAASGGSAAAITEVAWSGPLVFERVPELAATAGELGRPATEWFARVPDSAGRHLDALVELVAGLATPQRDNAVLVAQREGTAWLRSDVVPDTELAVDVLRYGPRTIFWLAHDGFTLYRFEGNNADGSRPVVVDLSHHGSRRIELPPPADVTDALTVADLYEAVTGELPAVP